MTFATSILDAVGQTPLVTVHSIIAPSTATVMAKCEYLNPMGSVKDRMALYIIRKAEEEGKLKAGGTIVENTSGNTGAALAMIAAVKGYRCIFTIPDKMSREKIDQLRAFGAEVIVTPTDVPPESPESYYSVARKIAEETPGAFYVDQYNNPDNVEAHYRSTGPEIWHQTSGEIDILIGGIGTGGTISGTARYLKDQNPSIKVVAVDPIGSVFYDYFTSGKMTRPHVYKVEGIGEDMLVKCVDFSVIDAMVQVGDEESFIMARRLAREEGLFAGGSSGSAIRAAEKVATTWGRGKRIVVILPDHGNRYISKLYSDAWMEEHYPGSTRQKKQCSEKFHMS